MVEEMVSQILSRLPPKSLMRFKCVRKSWCALVTDPRFIDQHLHLYKSSSTSILVNRTVMRKSSSSEMLVNGTVMCRTEIIDREIVLSLLHLHNDDDGHEGNLHAIVDDLYFPSSMGLKTRGQFIELPNYPEDSFIHIVGQCDGIICLLLISNPTTNLVLCNPAIKEFKNILPDFKSSGTVGFGYDPNSKDYIVLKFLSAEKEEYSFDHHVIYPPKATTYSMGTNSWREMKTNCLETETTNFLPEVFEMCYKGIFYWWGIEHKKELCCFDLYYEEEEDDKTVIIIYDTGDGLFHDILLPNNFYDIYNYGRYSMKIVVWNGFTTLVGFHYTFASPPVTFEFWVMDDFSSAKYSWIKHLTIEPVEDLTMAFTVWNNNNFLWKTKMGRIVSYNINTKKLNFLPMYCVDQAYFQSVVCVNSIISIHGGNNPESKDRYW